jgi:DNA-binding HxlR family transcriptional regulator
MRDFEFWSNAWTYGLKYKGNIISYDVAEHTNQFSEIMKIVTALSKRLNAKLPDFEADGLVS